MGSTPNIPRGCEQAATKNSAKAGNVTDFWHAFSPLIERVPDVLG